MPPKPKPLVDRLAAQSRREGKCLIFTGQPNTERPALMLPVKPKRKEYVYRIAYALAYGPIPEGYDVHHTCENMRCVEPSHLVARTREEHSQEHYVERGTCAQGHCWTRENTYIRGYSITGRPLRTCRRCRSISQARRDREKRATRKRQT
jgi:hypothetical protein